MAKETYTKMSQFGTSSYAAMKAAGATVPMTVAGQTNKKVPIGDFASSEDVQGVNRDVADLRNQIDLLAQREPSTKEVVTVATAADLGDIPDPSTQVIYKTLDDNKLYIYDGHVFVDVTGHAIDNTVYVADTSEILTLTLDDGVYSVLVVAGSTVTGTYSLSVSRSGRILSDKDGWADRIVSQGGGYAWRWHSYSYEGHKHTMDDITDYAPPPVDASLSDSSTNAVQNKVVKAALDLKGNITTIADSIVLSINPDTYVMSATLKKGNAVIAESNTIDLPLETMVVGGTYDSETKEVVLTLKNGQTVRFSVADLVSGLAPSNHTHVMADITDLHILPSSLRDGGAVSSSNIGSLQNNSAYSYGYTGSGSYASLDFVVEVDDGEVPNFMVTISATASGTVTVCKYKGGLYIPLYVSSAGGDSVESGKVYQLTCSDDGFALAEYSAPSSGLKTKIGDKFYRVVKIGNLYWMAANLCLTWTGLTIGGDPTAEESNTPWAWYYDNDEITYGNGTTGAKWGLLYNKAAINYLVEHPELLGGWRVPTENDIGWLQTTAGGNTAAGSAAVRKVSAWPNETETATDSTGFSAVPSCHAIWSAEGVTFDAAGTEIAIIHTDGSVDPDTNSSRVMAISDTSPTYLTGTDGHKYNGYSLRLCRDA